MKGIWRESLGGVHRYHKQQQLAIIGEVPVTIDDPASATIVKVKNGHRVTIHASGKEVVYPTLEAAKFAAEMML